MKQKTKVCDCKNYLKVCDSKNYWFIYVTAKKKKELNQCVIATIWRA
jgi:hypothetical protein